MVNSHKEQKETKEKPDRGSVTNWMVDWGLARLRSDSELSMHSVELDRLQEVITDETKLNKMLDSLEVARENLTRFSGDVGGSHSFEEANQRFENFISAEGDFDEKGNYKIRKKTFKEKAATAWDKTEDNFFLWCPVLFMKNLFVDSAKTKAISRYESEISLYFKLKNKLEDYFDKFEKGKEVAKKGFKNYKEFKRSMRENPAARALVGEYKTKARSLLDAYRSGGISPEKFTDSFRTLSGDVAKKGGRDLYDLAAANKVPGFTIKTTAQFMIMEVFTKSVVNAVEQRRFGAFTETLTDANVWIEAIPGVGSYRSIKRLFDENDATPMWLKGVDAGMNVIGDAFLLAGVVGSVFSAGSSLAGAAAIRSTITGVGTSMLRKSARKAVVKQVLKTTTSAAAKIVWSAAKMSLVSILVQEAFKRFVPDGKILEYTVEKVTDRTLSPAQKRAARMMMAAGD